ncbi:DUF3618 domain-containing protein [soil metagenome]
MHERQEEEIRERIEATRARMGETIEEIGERVNPDRVKAEIKAHARDQMHDIRDNVKRKARNTMRDVEHEVKDTGRGIWATIRENPVPAGMVGIGLAWLVANRESADSDRHRSGAYRQVGAQAVPYRTGREAGDYTGTGAYSAGGYGTGGYADGTGESDYTYDSGVDTGVVRGGSAARPGAGYAAAGGVREDAEQAAEGVRDRAEHAADAVRDKAVHAADTVRETAHEAVDTVRERASHVVESASERIDQVQNRVGHWSDEAQYYARRAERRVEYAVQDNPVAAGAMAMAIGLAAGLMIPETQKEHEAMGRTRDRLMDRAGEKAKQASRKMREVAKETIAEKAEHIVDDVWPEGDGQSQTGYTEPRR